MAVHQLDPSRIEGRPRAAHVINKLDIRSHSRMSITHTETDEIYLYITRCDASTQHKLIDTHKYIWSLVHAFQLAEHTFSAAACFQTRPTRAAMVATATAPRKHNTQHDTILRMRDKLMFTRRHQRLTGERERDQHRNGCARTSIHNATAADHLTG